MIRSCGFLAMALALPAGAAAQSWSGMKGEPPGTVAILSTPDKSSNASLALDDQGRPVAAWLESAAGTPSRIFASCWDSAASRWKRFGAQDELPTTGTIMTPAMDCLADGSPVVAYCALVAGRYEVYVLYFDPATATWKAFVDAAGQSSAAGGGLSQTPTFDSLYPMVRVNRATGLPVVAWFDSNILRMKTWTGGDWIGRAGSDGPAGISHLVGPAQGPGSMALDAAGNPVIAYADTAALTSTAQVYVVHLDPASGLWGGIGGSSTGLGVSNDATRTTSYPSLRLDPADGPAVAWQSFPASGDVVVAAGAGGGVGGGAYQDIHFRWWKNGAWTELNGSGTGAGISRSTANDAVYASTAFLPGPVPMVFWQSGTEIQARLWDEAADDWRGLGGSELAPGISGTPASSLAPRSAVAPDGSVYVCWEEGFQGNKTDITVGRWINSAPVIAAADQHATGPGGASVPVGGAVIDATSFTVTCTATDLEASPRILEVEARLVADPFTGAPTHAAAATTASALAVVVDGWTLGDHVKWQAWVREPGGKLSAIVDFGGNAAGTDLVLRSNAAPNSTAATMYLPSGSPLAPGSAILAREAIVLEAPVDDPDFDSARACFEIRRQDRSFTGVPSDWSPLTVHGGIARVTIVPAEEGPLMIQCAFQDEYGAMSAWRPLGGNPDDAPDLIVGRGGSAGSTGCGVPPAPAPAGMLLLAAVLSALACTLRS